MTILGCSFCLLLASALAQQLQNTGVSYWHGAVSGSDDGTAGYSMYTNTFPFMQQGYPVSMQMGLASTWLTVDQAESKVLDKCMCPTTFPCKDPNTNNAAYLAWSMEGGPGYWRDTLPKDMSAWRLGASSGCYSSYGRTLDSNPHSGSCDKMNVAQISNRMILPPDGVVMRKHGLVGWGYVDTPFGKTSAGDERNFWTLIFETIDFAGPVLYFLPEYWQLRDRGYDYTRDTGLDLGTCRALHLGEAAAEVQEVPTFKASTGEYKLAKMGVPLKNGRLVLSMGQRGYKRDNVRDVLEEALTTGVLYTRNIMNNGFNMFPANSRKSYERNAPFTVDSKAGKQWSMGTFNTTEEGGEAVWSLYPYCNKPEVTVKWYLGERSQSCTETCSAVGGNLGCDEDSLQSVDTAEDIIRIAREAGHICQSHCCGPAAGWAYDSNPAVCTHPGCCGDGSCTGICTFGNSGHRTCADANTGAYSRLCPCKLTEKPPTHSSSCLFPEYLTPDMKPLAEDDAPAELRDAVFPEKTLDQCIIKVFDALHGGYGECIDNPGPADSKLYCSLTLANTWLAWKWYKFVDQPALQRLGLSDEQKAFMQGRIESLHKMIGAKSEWMKSDGARAEGLGTFDPMVMVTPPQGLEVGYVPIALYEGMEKPHSCPEDVFMPSYLVAYKSLSCPEGYDAISSAEECQAAADWALDQSLQVEAPESDSRQQCWVSGSKYRYSHLYVGPQACPDDFKGFCSAVCKRTRVVAVKWYLGERSQSCTETCSAIGGSLGCDEDSLQSVDTAEEIIRIAREAGHTCQSHCCGPATGWAYDSNPAVCTDPGCCGDGSCTGICAFGMSGHRTCADADTGAYSRLCPCKLTQTPPTHEASSSSEMALNGGSSVASSFICKISILFGAVIILGISSLTVCRYVKRKNSIILPDSSLG